MSQRRSRIHAFRPSSPLTIVLAAAGLVGLIALVAAASRAHHTPGGHPGVHQPPGAVGDYLFSIFAIVLVAIAVLILYLWFSERDLLAERRRQRSKGTYRALVILLGIALIVSLFTRFQHELPKFGKEKVESGKVHPGTAPKQKVRSPKGAPSPEPPEFQWIPVFVATAFGMVLLGFVGLRAMRRAREDLVGSYRLEQAFEALLDDTLADLYGEKDPRAAIIKAYGRMEQLFASYGLPRDRAEAPMEYLARALGELRASGSALRRLTLLFQWAKFSDHDVRPSMRDDAIAALIAVRDELRANRLEEEQRHEEAERLRAQLQATLRDEDDRDWGNNPFAGLKEKVKGDVYGRGNL